MTRTTPQPLQLFASDSLVAEAGLALPLQEFLEQFDKLAN